MSDTVDPKRIDRLEVALDIISGRGPHRVPATKPRTPFQNQLEENQERARVARVQAAQEAAEQARIKWEHDALQRARAQRKAAELEAKEQAMRLDAERELLEADKLRAERLRILSEHPAAPVIPSSSPAVIGSKWDPADPGGYRAAARVYQAGRRLLSKEHLTN